MAGAATVAVRPKSGNAVIDFRPESAGKFWRACPGPARRPMEFYPQGGTGDRAVCPIAGMAPGNAAPLPAAAPSGAAPATAGERRQRRGAAVNPPPPGSRAQGRPLDPCLFACGNGPIACEGAAGMPDHHWKGATFPRRSRLPDGLKRAAGFRPPAQRTAFDGFPAGSSAGRAPVWRPPLRMFDLRMTARCTRAGPEDRGGRPRQRPRRRHARISGSWRAKLKKEAIS